MRDRGAQHRHHGDHEGGEQQPLHRFLLTRLERCPCAAIHEAGIRYLIFAANRAVRISIRRSGFTPATIGPARAECLGAAAASWGRYYDGDPQVMVGDMALTRQQVLAQPRLAATLRHYQPSIAALASAIAEHSA
ncbi:MAG: thermostable hemolysin [Haliea sp.]